MLVREGGAWIGDLGLAAPRRRSSRANDMLLGSIERPLMLGPDRPDFPIPNTFMFRPVQRTVRSVAEFEEAVAAADPFDTICVAADLSFTPADIGRGISSLQKPLRLIGADVEAHAEGHCFDAAWYGIRGLGGVNFPIRRHVLRVPSDAFIVMASSVALVNLTIFTGNIDVDEEPIGEGVHFPALEIRWGSVMIEDCNIFAQQGSGAILGRDMPVRMADGRPDPSFHQCRVHLRNCAIASPFLCVVARSDTTVTVRGCALTHYYWAASLGRNADVSELTKKDFLASNSFVPGEFTDETFHGDYDFTGQTVHPWRHGWSQ